ncbi:hypothetical protein BXZ70DRAFT_1024285 [Cristinia sonorae]|uniref:DUF6534 domain-containing protein n=1 Tax=Cristinia sonorae TaxID=1940300 RepID=A0A8K0UN20_9AGAR|nr:hypothetical protein BXZ70DRAFT_1024285 [Cristinia sonorae]
MSSDVLPPPPPPPPLLPLSYPQLVPAAFLGPAVVGIFIQTLETGIVINQSFTFWSRVGPESVMIRGIVAFVTLVALFQTATAFYAFWEGHVTHYGDWMFVTTFMWVDKISTVVYEHTRPRQDSVHGRTRSKLLDLALLACKPPSHIHPPLERVAENGLQVTRKNTFTLFTLMAVLLTSVVSSIMTTVNVLNLRFLPVVGDDAPPGPIKVPPNIPFILALASSSVLDVAITTILLVYLARAMENVYSLRFRRVMKRLMLIIWEAAVPPCLCAVVAIVTYLTMVDENWWDLMFQAILGKLYVISLFVTLNGRASLAETSNDAANDRLTSVAWVTSTPMRINVDVESRYQISQTTTGPDTPDGENMGHEIKSTVASRSERSKQLRTF